jgi:dTMP kinase
MEKSKQMRGKLIVFEGIEGCGKTTQIRAIEGWLREKLGSDGLEIVVTREPGGTRLGQHLRELLLHCDEKALLSDRAELLLYAADRAEHVGGLLKPHLARGNIILCDRFTDSTVAYQGYGRGLDLGEIDALNRIATGGLEPDLTLWLDVPVEAGLNRVKVRGKGDRIERADLEFHRRVREGFAHLARTHPHRIVRVSGNADRDRVTRDIQTILTQYLIKWKIID